MKQKIVVGGAMLALMLGAAGVASAAPAEAFADCAQAQAAGRTDIPRGDAAYVPALDRDDDGFACDAKDREAATHEVAAGTPDDTDLDADEHEDEDGDHDESGYEDDEDGAWGEHDDHEDHGDHGDYVVPEGGAATGDGSTDGATGWWVGGGLLAALAAAGVAFRHRLAGLAGR